MKNDYSIDRLLDIVAQLRAPDGCPWDREQTHESLKPYFIEETYEVIDAIDHNNSELLCEELGDVLLHVTFHSQLAKEKKAFSFKDVVKGIILKMIRRHPHVFKDEKVSSVEEVWKNWEKTKKEEKKNQQTDSEHVSSILNNVPKEMPSLYRAQKLQKIVANHGLDLESINGDPFDKATASLNKLRKESKPDDISTDKKEIGNLLFNIVSIARKLDIDAEEALRTIMGQFTGQLNHLEKDLKKQDKDISSLSSSEIRDMLKTK